MNAQKGIFITLEGFECCGKSTAAMYIEERLKKLGVDYTRTREPGGTSIAEDLRHLLLSQAINMKPETETTLFYAARIEHTAKLITPALANGEVVISDRYYDTTLAYQGAIGNEFTQNVHNFMLDSGQLAVPDLTILFDIDLDTYAQRKLDRGMVKGEEVNTFEDLRDSAYHARVLQRFRAMAKENPDRFIIVNANRPLSQVKESVLHIINRVIEDAYLGSEYVTSNQ